MGIFGFNERMVMNNRKPIVKMKVDVVGRIRFENRDVSLVQNPGERLTACIYANGEGELYLGDIPTGGGYMIATVDLSKEMRNLRPTNNIKIKVSKPYDGEVLEVLRNIERKYGIRLIDRD